MVFLQYYKDSKKLIHNKGIQMTQFYYWEDFYVGQKFICGPKTITESEIIDFANSYDHKDFILVLKKLLKPPIKVL